MFFEQLARCAGEKSFLWDSVACLVRMKRGSEQSPDGVLGATPLKQAHCLLEQDLFRSRRDLIRVTAD